jgi:squalene-hopene/tetraprenyl-beta-curcumene cyclase
MATPLGHWIASAVFLPFALLLINAVFCKITLSHNGSTEYGEAISMKAGILGIGALLACLACGASVACSHPASSHSSKISSTWDPKAAAAYLDYREGWWAEWTGSARDHGTFCVSCHTALPYALARPALRVALAEPGPSVNERRLIEDVTKRVRLWKDVGPYYSDQGYDHKTAESRGTESVLNALILASHDAPSGQLTDDTRAAFDHMWAMQLTTGENAGSWPWLQFDQEPWEANDSGYYGAALAAMALGMAPGNYASSPEIQGNLTRLRQYLNRESAAQSTINRVFLLWASTKLPGVLSPEQQKAIIHEVLSKQQADGGWRLASITWKWSGWSVKSLANMWIREDGTPMGGKSDGLATSLVTLALQQAGVPADNPQLKHGLSWVMSNQNAAEGFWPASSVNKRRHISSDTGRFMSDAATAFAVLALTENQRTTNRTTGQVASVSNH